MKRLIPLVAIILIGASAAWAATPATLTTLRAIHALTNAEAHQRLPVEFEATVTFFNPKQGVLFVQDDGVGIYVSPKTNFALATGDRVLIHGKTAQSFRPIVNSDSITLVHRGALPKPVPATFDELIHGQQDCVLVTARGIVRSVDPSDLNSQSGNAFMEMQAEGGYIGVNVGGYTPGKREQLLDTEVEITGVAGGTFDGKMQMHGVQLNVTSFENVKVIARADASPWSLPTTPMDLVISGYHVTDRTPRVLVHGTITYFQPGSSVVLQNGRTSLWISTLTTEPLRVGDVADAIGFPEAHNGFLGLARGEVRDSGNFAPITPLATTREQLAASRHIIDLVSVEGQVVTAVREAAQDEYVLMADGQLFTAIVRHPAVGPAPPMREIPIGASVRVTGICVTENSNPFESQVPFDILMRTPDDIAVVARASLLNIKNLIIVIGLLLAVVFAVGARGWAIEYRVRRQTAALALIEQRRSRILEDINGSKPLAEIVEQITELVSYMQRGAPCWCQIADGAQLGNCPPKLTGLRIVQNEIPSHAGPALGSLFVAFDRLAQPRPNEAESVSMAIALTALAIETRRLYTDLLHRSEFDLLTDIHNRFSLDKYLDRQIDEARQNAGIFGLIYIDLDKFKQINDIYGHQVGDLYLQEVAIRMKHQLRGIDMLARLGGDEFAVLLPQVRARSRVEEIAQRLERSFDEPFTIEGHVLHGSASIGIALYPADGATKDELLIAADSAMYEVKHSKGAARSGQAERRNSLIQP
jgi:diguanylate cyclase (GGDEF)-like protein